MDTDIEAARFKAELRRTSCISVANACLPVYLYLCSFPLIHFLRAILELPLGCWGWGEPAGRACLGVQLGVRRRH